MGSRAQSSAACATLWCPYVRRPLPYRSFVCCLTSVAFRSSSVCCLVRCGTLPLYNDISTVIVILSSFFAPSNRTRCNQSLTCGHQQLFERKHICSFSLSSTPDKAERYYVLTRLHATPLETKYGYGTLSISCGISFVTAGEYHWPAGLFM